MKVLHTYRTYFPDPPGGLQEAIRQICLATGRYGIDNTIFTLSPEPSPSIIERPEATVVRERSIMAPASCDLGGRQAVKTFSRLVGESDVVHYLFPWPFSDVLHQLSRHGKPTVLTYISDIVRQRWLGSLYAPLMWKTLRSVDVIVANCNAYVESSPVLSHPEIRPKVRIIPLAIDDASYPQQGDECVLDRLGIAHGSPFFLFLGVLRYYKGLDYLIRAMRDLPRVPLVIAGSGPCEAELRSLVATQGLANVIFAGQVSDAEKVALIRACRALVLPSHLRSEAYGMVLVEAAMLGCPMISCEIGTGTSFINQHGLTGLVVPPENPEALMQAMNVLLHDQTKVDLMGKAARARYQTMFSGEAMGQAYQSLFCELAGK